MTAFQLLLFGFLIVCAVSVSFSKNLLNSILIFMSYSLAMSVIWITLESPDLAITEAAVGAGITSVLFFVTLKKIQAVRVSNKDLMEESDKNMTLSEKAQETGYSADLSKGYSTDLSTGHTEKKAINREAAHE